MRELGRARPMPRGRTDLACGAKGLCMWTRRVQLVRRDGRDVSTLYGRGGGGVMRAARRRRAPPAFGGGARVEELRGEGGQWELARAGGSLFVPRAGSMWTRRVQLVRRDGRDVSTLYGREGAGAGGREHPQVHEHRDELRKVHPPCRAAKLRRAAALLSPPPPPPRRRPRCVPTPPGRPRRVRLVRGEGRGVSD